MPIFKFGDIIPFPYVEVATVESRPVVVISRRLSGPRGHLFYTMMVTSAANQRWPDDISLENDHADYGLPRPSVLRVAKIASVEMREATLIGRLHGPKLDMLRDTLRQVSTL